MTGVRGCWLTGRVRFRAAERGGDGNLDSLRPVLSPPAALTPTWKSQACRKDTLVPQWSLGDLVRDLQALRGVALLVAVTLVSEVGDMRRFGSAKHLMSFLGERTPQPLLTIQLGLRVGIFDPRTWESGNGTACKSCEAAGMGIAFSAV